MVQVDSPETGAWRSPAWSSLTGEIREWGIVCHNPLAERKQGDTASSLHTGTFHVPGTWRGCDCSSGLSRAGITSLPSQLSCVEQDPSGTSAESGAFSVPALSWLCVPAGLGCHQLLLCWNQCPCSGGELVPQVLWALLELPDHIWPAWGWVSWKCLQLVDMLYISVFPASPL